MNKLTIIGNLTRAPELRTVTGGYTVCDFTVAVNRRGKNKSGQQETDYFHCTAWNQLGEICAQYLDKGRKVYVAGPVSARIYQANDGSTRASLEIKQVEDVEFLTPRGEGQTVEGQGFAEVDVPDLPWGGR